MACIMCMASSPSALASVAKAAALPVPPPPSSSAGVAGARRRAPVVATVLRACSGGHARRGAALVAASALEDLRPAMDEYPEGVLSGEWPGNFSLLSYADLRAYLESQITTAGEVRSVLRPHLPIYPPSCCHSSSLDACLDY